MELILIVVRPVVLSIGLANNNRRLYGTDLYRFESDVEPVKMIK